MYVTVRSETTEMFELKERPILFFYVSGTSVSLLLWFLFSILPPPPFSGGCGMEKREEGKRG
jgi:hypothetical protein